LHIDDGGCAGLALVFARKLIPTILIILGFLVLLALLGIYPQSEVEARIITSFSILLFLGLTGSVLVLIIARLKYRDSK
jgi:hypothetical protein